MELSSVSRIHLVFLMLSVMVVLNVSLAWAAGATALDQTAQSQSSDSADEELSSFYRQPLESVTLERMTRAGVNSQKVPFYPNYRYGGSIRLITPYALQHLLSSRFQNTDYPGKRMGSEFLGKKRSNLAPLSYSGADSDATYGAAMQKKMGSEFLGRRKRALY